MFFHNFNASKNAMNRKGEMMKRSRRHKIYILFPSGCVCKWSANSNSFWQCASEAATGISQQKYNEIYTTWQFMVFFPLFIFFLAPFIIISHIQLFRNWSQILHRIFPNCIFTPLLKYSFICTYYNNKTQLCSIAYHQFYT